MYCNKCGTQNPDDASFCVKCGNNFGSIKPEIERKGITGEWVTAESLKRIAAIKPERKGITGKLGKMGIPGFRSGKTWKMILATLVYFYVGLAFISGLIFGMDTPNEINAISTITTPKPTSTPQVPVLVSTSFSDYGAVYCDSRATSLQKETLFNDKFKNKYVKWTGIESSVSETWGLYELKIKHCEKTWTSDIGITMKEDQKDKLLQLREGDTVTYMAKLTNYYEILDLSAKEGEIIEVQSKTTVVSTPKPTQTQSQKNIIINYSAKKVSSIGYSEADSGKTFLIITMNIENRGYDEFRTNPYFFELISNNVKYETSLKGMIALDDDLDTVDLLNGGSIKGSLAFEVPSNIGSYQIQYEGWSDYEIIYKQSS